MAWRKSSNSSSVKPPAVDRELSKVVVYIRKDFVEVPFLDESGNPTGETHWEYLETTVPKDVAYILDETSQNTANIAYIAMMSDIELGEE